MDELVFGILNIYYDTLQYTGYMPDRDVHKLLVLAFYKDFIYGDYRGIISKEDYQIIERALNCLYGTSCLIPYPDYLKMGKLRLGELSEMAQRLKKVEDTEVLKAVAPFDLDNDSDLLIMEGDALPENCD